MLCLALRAFRLATDWACRGAWPRFEPGVFQGLVDIFLQGEHPSCLETDLELETPSQVWELSARLRDRFRSWLSRQEADNRSHLRPFTQLDDFAVEESAGGQLGDVLPQRLDAFLREPRDSPSGSRMLRTEETPEHERSPPPSRSSAKVGSKTGAWLPGGPVTNPSHGRYQREANIFAASGSSVMRAEEPLGEPNSRPRPSSTSDALKSRMHSLAAQGAPDLRALEPLERERSPPPSHWFARAGSRTSDWQHGLAGTNLLSGEPSSRPRPSCATDVLQSSTDPVAASRSLDIQAKRAEEHRERERSPRLDRSFVRQRLESSDRMAGGVADNTQHRPPQALEPPCFAAASSSSWNLHRSLAGARLSNPVAHRGNDDELDEPSLVGVSRLRGAAAGEAEYVNELLQNIRADLLSSVIKQEQQDETPPVLRMDLLKKMMGRAGRFDPAQDPDAWELYGHLAKEILVRDLKQTHGDVSKKFLNGPHSGQSVEGLTKKLLTGEVLAKDRFC